MKPVLLILDPQSDFFEASNPNLAEFERAVAAINEAISVFREHHWTVAFVQHSSPTKEIGSYPWTVYEGFDCRPEDARVYKTWPDAFLGTELSAILEQCQVDFVLVAGFLAERCVLATYLGAIERGYRGAVLEEGTASLNSQHMQSTLDIVDHLTLGDFLALVEQEDAMYAKQLVGSPF